MTIGGDREGDEQRLRSFAAAHALRIRLSAGRDERGATAWLPLGAMAPDGSFEIGIVETRTAEPGYRFWARSPPRPTWLERVRRRHPASTISFTVLPRPSHMPYVDTPFTGDSELDARWMVRPETDEVRRVLTPEVLSLLRDVPCSFDVTNGVVSVPVDLDHEQIRRVATLFAAVRHALRLA